MNPSRGFSAALLCALLGASALAQTAIPNGRCSGKGGPAAAPIQEGPAYDLRARPLKPEKLSFWKQAGYGVDASSSRLLSPAGKPLPEAEYERLMAPFDAGIDRMSNGAWSTLLLLGYRLNDDNCRLLEPTNRQPVTRLEIIEFEKRIGAGSGNSALETLLVELKGANPSKPPPAAVLARMAELEARGEKLPDNFRRALAGRTLSAGALRGQAEEVYAKTLRGWENSAELMELGKLAEAPVPGYNAPAVRKGRIESWEQVVGDGFSSDIQSNFLRTESGRELLSRFRDAHGNSELPKVTVLKLSQRPNDAGYGAAAAVYDNSSRTVILSHWYVVSQILAAVPPAERQKLGTQLSDSRALAEYLREHPDRRAAVSDRMDVTVFHELTHAWQARRDALSVETARGNAAGGIILAHEHEAFDAMYRYMHEKLMRDPGAALRSPEYGGYLAMIADPYKYRDNITREYQATFIGSTDFKTLEQIQAERQSILGLPAGWKPSDLARAVIDRFRLARGEAALKTADRTSTDLERKYFRETVPRMRAEAAAKLPAYFASVGRPDQALNITSVAHLSPKDDRRPEWAAAAAAQLARRDPSLSLEERLTAFNTVLIEMKREDKPVPPEVWKAYARDALEYAGRATESARTASDPAQRAAAIKLARDWLRAAPAKDPATAALSKKLDVLEKRR
ncbi:MAG: hypothetical protein ACHQ51_02295 [Elusimicrobiota bacterium]